MVDGYSAPLTAGNFVRNVLEGAYTNSKVRVDQNAIVDGADTVTGAHVLQNDVIPQSNSDRRLQTLGSERSTTPPLPGAETATGVQKGQARLRDKVGRLLSSGGFWQMRSMADAAS